MISTASANAHWWKTKVAITALIWLVYPIVFVLALPYAKEATGVLGFMPVIEALVTAQERANAPLLGELQGIRAALERLEAAQPELSSPMSQREKPEPSEPGPVVQRVRRLF